VKEQLYLTLVDLVVLTKKGDCDTINTAAIVIARDRYDIPANITRGDTCDASYCVITNNITHAWGNVLEKDGYLRKMDVTPSR
jgi:transglutaminase-like putative cysteine protease